MKTSFTTISLISIAALTGCNSATQEEIVTPAPVVTPEPTTRTVTANTVDRAITGTFEVSGTAAAPVFKINGVTVAGLTSSAVFNTGAGLLANSSLKLFSDGQPNKFFYGETTGGKVAIGGSTNLGAGAYTAATISRTGDTELPLTGTAKFNGDYVGFIQQAVTAGGANDAISIIITGDVAMNADLAASTLDGMITNRVGGNHINGTIFVGNTFDDITLVRSTANSDGVYIGTTTGGAIRSAGVTNGVGTGAYRAMMVGPNGENVIGIVDVEHLAATAPATTFPQDGGVEVGGFIAKKQ